MNIKIIYNTKQKPPITERMKQYAVFAYEKVDFNKLPKIKDGRYVDWEYLYDYAEGYDGVMAVFAGNELDGVYGANKEYRGKHLMQAEWRDGYRKWKQNKVTRLWNLVFTKQKADYLQVSYTMEHEFGHALCDYLGFHDNLHSFISLKRYEQWWDYQDFPSLKSDITGFEIFHEKSGEAIIPKCYILHTDMGSEKGTYETIVKSDESVSYNYYVNKKGFVTEYVIPGYEAWHSGVVHNPTPTAKKFFGNKNPNSMSIGICFEGRGEDANPAQKEAIRKIITEDPMPIFAHKEITDYKPQAPLNLKREFADLSGLKTPSVVVIKLIEVLQKLGIVT